MDSLKVEVKLTNNFGLGVFATDSILPGEVIAEFDGEIFDYDYDGWNDELSDHVIQFSELRWRGSNGVAQYFNHSCEPNCVIQDLFKIVSIRTIKRGEELTWDYDTTEHDEIWRMKCLCGHKSCRGEIGSLHVKNGLKKSVSI